MTLRPGEAWGERVEPPVGLIEIGSDANAAIHAGLDRLPVRLIGGDLLASLGGRSRGRLVNRYTIDLLRVRTERADLVALAHVVARGRTWWRGPISAVFNADRLGRWDVAPRAHPGDGRFDTAEVDAAMSVRARWQAWRRMPTGTHVPHPLIRTGQRRDVTWELDPPRRLWLDGVDRGWARSVVVTIEPAGVVVYT